MASSVDGQVQVIEQDIFTMENVKSLLKNKFVCFIGDSVIRGMYKDLVALLEYQGFMDPAMLKKKGEDTFLTDELVEGGLKDGALHNGKNYRELRNYVKPNYMIRFYFVTRAWNDYLESILSDFRDDMMPDVIIMNSCVWDITRYGEDGIDQYRRCLREAMSNFRRVLSPDTLFMWTTTLPVGAQVRGGFLLKELQSCSETLRLDILEANIYAAEIVSEFGFDVLDLHYHFRSQTRRQIKDGIHWDQTAHRRASNIILTHIALAWHRELPGNGGPWKALKQRNQNAPGPDKRQPSYGNHRNEPYTRPLW